MNGYNMQWKIIWNRYCMAVWLLVLAYPVAGQTQHKRNEPDEPGAADRRFWVHALHKIAYPVVHHLSCGSLAQQMPVEVPPGMHAENFKKVTYLEAVGRTFAGLAPWLGLPDDNSEEGLLRTQLKHKIVQGLTNAVDPSNPDCLNFKTELQPIVDAAFLAHAFLRAPHVFWTPLDSVTKRRYVDAYKSLRNRSGAYNNWLLFAGLNETFLVSIGEDYDPARISFARNKLKEWYVGDGWYSDGATFSLDYYNDYVIHPMLVDMLKVLVDKKMATQAEYDQALLRMVRHSEFSERIISPEGSFPPVGRSITYRTAVFQSLNQVAVLEKLPASIKPAQVRSALTKVFKNMYEGNQNFDSAGWLVLGFNGHQPALADTYTSTGSLYMATLGFLALGLPADNKFWTDPPADWTSKKAWSGLPVKKDYKVEY